MALADVRAQIKAILSGASGVGRVHDYERFAKDQTKFLELFKASDGTINCWTMARQASAERQAAAMHCETSDMWVIRGYRAVNDDAATEMEFQETIENIRAKFRAAFTLNGVCETTSPDFGPETGSGIQVRLVDYRVFFGVLCHYCELALGVENTVDI